MRRPIDSALSVAQGLVEQLESSRGIPSVGELMAVIRSFERVEFDVPAEIEADGFLFQYGEANWFNDPTFTVGFVRQLELVDAEEEHEGYSQVQLEYRYPVDTDLRSLGDHNSWWFPESGVPFGEWLESVKRDPVWEVVREKIPTEFDVSQELV
ncbi:hypothetical protein HII36_32010 [Nonomuraea sp. NN258]|uniref:hypothetical protein n=1 Tax=Nonomuraea antri TaxID=2730852 RepID=UPI0015689829|nr:hypothetical protein [Nonomuraea antri]NRQ36425.1 hypothetical protein [Nonomuraea antri]